MREYKAQKEIVSIATEKKPLPKGEKGLKTYRFLVQYRFFEVLENGYPIFYSRVDKKRFEKAVIAFMQYGSKSSVMWQVPNEFRLFIKKQKYFRDMPYVDDLLWFEWIEVALMMKNYRLQEGENFSWKKEYKLSSSVVLKKLKYKVFDQSSLEQRGEYFLLAYYDFKSHQVFYREISYILYLFLKSLKKEGLQASLQKISELTGESKERVKEFFLGTLEELNSLYVIQRR